MVPDALPAPAASDAGHQDAGQDSVPPSGRALASGTAASASLARPARGGALASGSLTSGSLTSGIAASGTPQGPALEPLTSVSASADPPGGEGGTQADPADLDGPAEADGAAADRADPAAEAGLEPGASAAESAELAEGKESSEAHAARAAEDVDDRAWEASAAPRGMAASLRALSLPARLEAILYLKGRPLPLAELAEIAGITTAAAELALITLMTDYAHRDTALEIHQEGQSFSLQLREGLGDLVQSLIPVDLSTAALRTLATIALKTRILQSELVELRGSGAYDHIKELLAQDFIERRRQSEGRSYWLSLSEKFHRTFAIQGQENLARPRRRQGAGASGAAPAGEEREAGDDSTSSHEDA